MLNPDLNIYTTSILLLIVPAFFVGGLILIPVGLWLKRRSDARKGITAEDDGVVGALLKQPRARRNLLFFAVATGVNIVLVGVAGHEAVSFMETPKFCGTVCHSIMQPEYEAYLRSPHSRVHCVECHIGPGASWAVKSKLDGLRQVWHALRGDYHRPIKNPVHTLRPARETCEKCHWPDKFHGNTVIFRMHYTEDEKNTPFVNALVLKIGGENQISGKYEGIHWHVSHDTEVRYEALDEKREKIGKVEVLRDGKVVETYLPPEEGQPVLETRIMDCVDCHNRPTHQFDGSPKQAVEWALRTGVLDRKVPWLRKLAVPILEKADHPREGVEAVYEKELAAAYDAEHPDLKPDAETIRKAAAGMAELYRRNIYPRMHIVWNTYATHIGHAGAEADKRGCFRCHDEKHKTKDGKTLSQDCELCHEMLADEEAPQNLDDPLKTLLFGN
jgi:nitrate/TMAO reductase-like tetraheme cytochrome c subunit